MSSIGQDGASRLEQLGAALRLSEFYAAELY
jgi:hypothetical protein